MRYSLIIFGPPGAGKGTQCKHLASELGVPHISTGDLFREHFQNKTELGKQAQEYIQQGHLVPDDLVLNMVRERLNQPDIVRGVIFDGFPRTIEQAEKLKELAKEVNIEQTLIFNLNVPDKNLIRRISGRRVSREGGYAYHIEFNPPKIPGICDITGSELYQRDDDKEEVVKERLKEYYLKTEPVLNFYKKGDFNLWDIDGTGKIKEITEEILDRYDRYFYKKDHQNGDRKSNSISDG